MPASYYQETNAAYDAMARKAFEEKVSEDDVDPPDTDDLARAAGPCDRCGKPADRRHLHGYGSGTQYLCTACAFRRVWSDCLIPARPVAGNDGD
jgi:hypothetical protein